MCNIRQFSLSKHLAIYEVRERTNGKRVPRDSTQSFSDYMLRKYRCGVQLTTFSTTNESKIIVFARNSTRPSKIQRVTVTSFCLQQLPLPCWRYTMSQQYKALNLRMLAKCGAWNYASRDTASTTKLSVRIIVRFPQALSR